MAPERRHARFPLGGVEPSRAKASPVVWVVYAHMRVHAESSFLIGSGMYAHMRVDLNPVQTPLMPPFASPSFGGSRRPESHEQGRAAAAVWDGCSRPVL